jgi:hypothetical protein
MERARNEHHRRESNSLADPTIECHPNLHALGGRPSFTPPSTTAPLTSPACRTAPRTIARLPPGPQLFGLPDRIINHLLAVQMLQRIPIMTLPCPRSVVQRQTQECQYDVIDFVGVDLHGHNSR